MNSKLGNVGGVELTLVDGHLTFTNTGPAAECLPIRFGDGGTLLRLYSRTSYKFDKDGTFRLDQTPAGLVVNVKVRHLTDCNGGPCIVHEQVITIPSVN